MATVTELPPDERWIPGYPGYSATAEGKIVSYRRLKRAFVAANPNPNGYLYSAVRFEADRTTKTHLVHRLVALAWLQNPEGKPHVNHKNGNKHDNRYTNLEYVTVKENRAHALRTGLHKRKAEAVYQLTLGGEVIKLHDNAKAAAESAGPSAASIGQVCSGRAISAGGFFWCYKSKYVPGIRARISSTTRPVEQYSLAGELVARFDTLTSANDKTGIKSEIISSACRSESHIAGGFVWKLVPQLIETKMSEYDQLGVKDWRIIPGFSLYRISESGDIYSLQVKKVLKSRAHGSYRMASIFDDTGTRISIGVHRLVALTYIPNPGGLPIVNHRDGDPSNNNVANLEWCTSSENTLHAIRTGLTKIWSKKVYKLDISGTLVEIFISAKEAAESCNIQLSTLARHARYNEKYKGHYWTYDAAWHPPAPVE